MDITADRPEKKRRTSDLPDSAKTSDYTAHAPTHGGTVEQVSLLLLSPHQPLLCRLLQMYVHMLLLITNSRLKGLQRWM
jgi:hypothetical protein